MNDEAIDVDLSSVRSGLGFSVAKNAAGCSFVARLAEVFQSDGSWRPLSVRMSPDDDKIHILLEKDDLWFMLKTMVGVAVKTKQKTVKEILDDLCKEGRYEYFDADNKKVEA